MALALASPAVWAQVKGMGIACSWHGLAWRGMAWHGIRAGSGAAVVVEKPLAWAHAWALALAWVVLLHGIVRHGHAMGMAWYGSSW